VAGIRTRHTQASDAAWAAGHTAALPRVSRTVPVAVATVVATVITTVLGGSGWGAAVGVTGLLVETVVLVSAAGVANAAARKTTFPGAEG